MSPTPEPVVDAHGEVLDAERLGIGPNGKFDPHVLAHQVRVFGEQRADRRAAAEVFDQTKGAVLSQLTNRVRGEHPDLTRKEAEDIAKGSEEFMAHIRDGVEARRLADQAEARWRAALVLSDGLRTVEATQRAERQAYRN